MSVTLTTPPPVFGFSADLLRVVFTCSAYESLENYAIRFKLFIQEEGSVDFKLIYNSRLPVIPGAGGQAHAYIGDKLHDEISADIDDLGVEYPEAAMLHCARSCRAYRFEYAESYGADIEDQQDRKSTRLNSSH